MQSFMTWHDFGRQKKKYLYKLTDINRESLFPRKRLVYLINVCFMLGIVFPVKSNINNNWLSNCVHESKIDAFLCSENASSVKSNLTCRNVGNKSQLIDQWPPYESKEYTWEIDKKTDIKWWKLIDCFDTRISGRLLSLQFINLVKFFSFLYL